MVSLPLFRVSPSLEPRQLWTQEWAPVQTGTAVPEAPPFRTEGQGMDLVRLQAHENTLFLISSTLLPDPKQACGRRPKGT